jgi:hypothetical protein
MAPARFDHMCGFESSGIAGGPGGASNLFCGVSGECSGSFGGFSAEFSFEDLFNTFIRLHLSTSLYGNSAQDYKWTELLGLTDVILPVVENGVEVR